MKYVTINQESVTADQILQVLTDINKERFGDYFYIIQNAWDFHFWVKAKGSKAPAFSFQAKKRSDATVTRLNGKFPKPSHVHIIWMWQELRKAIAFTFEGKCGCSERGPDSKSLAEQSLREFLQNTSRGSAAFRATAPPDLIEKLEKGQLT